MLQTCRTIDLRTQAADEFLEALDRLHPDEALLLISKTSFPVQSNRGAVWRLIEGPSIHQTVYTHSVVPQPRLSEQRRRHQRWLDAFPVLQAAAAKGEDVAGAGEALVQEILDQQEWEERVVYPVVGRFLHNERAVRELGYEHLGLRRLAPTLPPLLQEIKTSTEAPRKWERFRLDVVHLLEHHIEHEEKGVFPLYERLAQV